MGKIWGESVCNGGVEGQPHNLSNPFTMLPFPNSPPLSHQCSITATCGLARAPFIRHSLSPRQPHQPPTPTPPTLALHLPSSRLAVQHHRHLQVGSRPLDQEQPSSISTLPPVYPPLCSSPPPCSLSPAPQSHQCSITATCGLARALSTRNSAAGLLSVGSYLSA